MTGTPAPGQFAVTHTNGWRAKAIQFVTRSDVNHALLCVYLTTDGDAQCIEARPKGAGWVKASKYPDARWSNVPLTPQQVKGITYWAKLADGTPYGWLDCAAAGIWSLKHRWGWTWIPESKWALERLADLHTLMCSQLVADAFAYVDDPIIPDEPPCVTSPGDLSRTLD